MDARKKLQQQVRQKNDNNKNSDDAEDDDYMSDKILSTIDDTRPGLLFSRATARKFEQEKKHSEQNEKNRTKSEVERREEALAKPVQSTIGLNLMKKMGFKEGMTLGKTSTSAISEPIAIKLKADREGLGSESEKKRKAQEHAERWAKLRKSDDAVTQEAFLAAKRSDALMRKLKGCLAKAQRVCYELDCKQMIKEPLEDWFWPTYALSPPSSEENISSVNKNKEEVEEEKSECEEVEALKRALKRPLVIDEVIVREDEDDELIDKQKQIILDDEFNEQVLTHRCDSICAYLRRQHLYCVWCAVRFNDVHDLENNCPGLTFDAHEEI